ncbi:MAG: hypothetical protein IJW81_06385 [Clostridia bacterium]|nr:hypothetical protein [Clostridia bacterium]
MFEKNMKFPLLLDTYGVLLTERKREILDYYYNDDYSLSEISELTGISRQGVRDSIKKSEEEIYGYESRLKIVEKYEEIAGLCERAASAAVRLTEESDDVSARAKEILSLLERLKAITGTQTADVLEPELRE